MIAAIIQDEVIFSDEVVNLCLLTVQSIEMKADVLGFEVPVDNLMETQIVLRIENFPNNLFCFLLRQKISSFHQLVQVTVAVFKE